MRYLNEVKLAGLLHDIGKFYQKAGTNKVIAGIEVKGHHALVSANFVEHYRTTFDKLELNVDAVKEMVQRHHTNSHGKDDSIVVSSAKVEYKHLCNIVNVADNISSSERIEATDISKGGHYAVVPLTSIFSVWASDKKQNYPVGEFTKMHSKATASHTANNLEENAEHISKFAAEFEGIVETNFDSFFNKLNTLLKKYLWCIPSDSQQRLPDVSLYDHLKTTSALATIMYEELVSNTDHRKGLHEDKKAKGWEFKENAVNVVDCFALVKIGVHGVEDFISKNHTQSVSDLEYIEHNKKFIGSRLDKLQSDILNIGVRLGEVNVVISQTYSRYILINSNHIREAMKLTKRHNNSVALETSLEIYFEMAAIQIPKHAMGAQNVHQYMVELDTCYNNSGLIDSKSKADYCGMQDILTTNGIWNEGIGVGRYDSIITIDIVSDKVKSRIKEFISKTDNKTLSIVKLRADNLSNAMENMFRIDEKTLNTLSSNYKHRQEVSDDTEDLKESDSSEEREYATISRIATANRMISEAMALAYKDTISLLSSPSEVVFLAATNDVLNKVNQFKNRLDRMTFGGITYTAHIVTFKASDELEYAYKKLDTYCKEHNTSKDCIFYNGARMTWENVEKAIKLMDSIHKSLSLNKSSIYKIQEFISRYYDYVRIGNVSNILGIARFFNTKEKHFSDKNTDKVVVDFVTQQFDLINSGKEPSHMLAVFLELINDTISIKIRE